MIKELDLIQLTQGSRTMCLQFDLMNKCYIAHLFDSMNPTKYQAPIILKSAGVSTSGNLSGLSPLKDTTPADIFTRLRGMAR